MRTLVIGDIHSNYKALKQVIERSSYNYNEDLLIFLGDYVDGYSQAKETLDFLIEIENNSVIKVFKFKLFTVLSPPLANQICVALPNFK